MPKTTLRERSEKMERFTSIDGVEHKVKFEPRAAEHSYEFEVEGNRNLADVQEVEPDIYSILVGTRSYEVKIEEAEGYYIVGVNGNHFEVAVRDSRLPRRQTGISDVVGSETVLSPMPGRVVKVEVKLGETVEAGQGLVVIEAMKMQNEIKCLKAGSVKSVHVEEGTTVGAGDPMVVIE